MSPTRTLEQVLDDAAATTRAVDQLRQVEADALRHGWTRTHRGVQDSLRTLRLQLERLDKEAAAVCWDAEQVDRQEGRGP